VRGRVSGGEFFKRRRHRDIDGILGSAASCQDVEKRTRNNQHRTQRASADTVAASRTMSHVFMTQNHSPLPWKLTASVLRCRARHLPQFGSQHFGCAAAVRQRGRPASARPDDARRRRTKAGLFGAPGAWWRRLPLGSTLQKLPRGSYLDPLVLPDGAVAACGAGAVREWKVNLGVLGPAQPPHLA